MAIMLGKRKRKSQEPVQATEQQDVTSQSSLATAEEDIQAVFRRHFEAQFKPLGGVKKPVQREPEPLPVKEVEEESDWSGLSEEEDAVEVIEHSAPAGAGEVVGKYELKAFMSSKPPSAASKPSSTVNKKPDDEEGEALNLKNDLALQRLLKESHLLDPTSRLDPSGANRHKAIDLRLQSLGSKASILAQEKMPLAHRKGILAKAAAKEQMRRREAKENGIILEKALKVKKGGDQKRERGVGGPGIGKFRGGTLKLSKRDIADIQGPKRTAFAKKSRR